MRRIFRPFVILLSALALTASCLSDDDQTNITYYSDTAVTSFSLGTLNRTMWTTSSEGEDSSYVVEIDGSEYDFYIDQLAKRIYNADSLPKGTDAAHVLCSAGTKNGGLAIWAFKDSAGEDSLVYLNSTDSVDFTEPRELRVYSNSGLEYRSYTVEVNVHKEDSATINWQAMGAYAPFTALEGMKALVAGGDRLLVLGKSGGETVVYAKDGGAGWTEALRLEGGEVYAGAVARGDSVYTVMADGSVARSQDGASWTREAVAGEVKPVRLVAAGSGRLYGVTADGRMASSAHAGYGWSVDGQPADMSELPAADVVALSLPGTPQTEGLFDAARLARCKRGAILLNVGRGSAVDNDALAAAVQSGALFGAALDVTDPEPLPPGHPLWGLDNVFITPHISGRFSLPQTLENIVGIFAHNLRLYAAGQPLDNQMSRTQRYVSADTPGRRLTNE